MKRIIPFISILLFSTIASAFSPSDIKTRPKGWQTTVIKDEMRETKNYMFTLSSNDTIESEIVILTITVKNSDFLLYFVPHKNNMPTSGCLDYCKVAFKIDNGKVEIANFKTYVTDRSVVYILQNESEKIIERIINGRQLIIELPYKDHLKQTKFITEGFGFKK